MAVLNLTPALAKVGVTSGFPEGKLTLREVAVQGWKVGKGLTISVSGWSILIMERGNKHQFPVTVLQNQSPTPTSTYCFMEKVYC